MRSTLFIVIALLGLAVLGVALGTDPPKEANERDDVTLSISTYYAPEAYPDRRGASIDSDRADHSRVTEGDPASSGYLTIGLLDPEYRPVDQKNGSTPSDGGRIAAREVHRIAFPEGRWHIDLDPSGSTKVVFPAGFNVTDVKIHGTVPESMDPCGRQGGGWYIGQGSQALQDDGNTTPLPKPGERLHLEQGNHQIRIPYYVQCLWYDTDDTVSGDER